MKKFIYFFRKVWLFIKKAFLISIVMNDDQVFYELWCCVERPDGSTFNQCIDKELGFYPPKGFLKHMLEKDYFGKGYKVCKIWLVKK